MGTTSEVDYHAEERANPGFDVDAMTALLFEGQERAQRVRQLAQLVASDPVFRKEDRTSLSRPAAMDRALEKAKHLYKRSKELSLSDDDYRIMRFHVDDICYADLHWFMFIPAIEGQASPEQVATWLPLAKRYAWIGCYAQTELGHGSNVQGLETLAVFDNEKDEFDIHSPTLTSTKWWPGGLGKVSTHAVVYARLLSNGKDHGVQAFLVQLRSLQDHLPMPGVTVADIGTKFGNGGYNTMDNGLLRFQHVRIPRSHLLAKYGHVTRGGEYKRTAGVPRQLGYGAMVAVRRGIVVEAGLYLSRAVTIAVRYSAIRRQFGGGADGLPETKVLDYRTQQHRLLPLLATAYAFRFAGRWIAALYAELMVELHAGRFRTLAEAHAATAGLKALTTAVTADGIEECRKLCGGHGYLCASGLPELFAAYVPACTYEGDNIVLLLQVARFLVKTVGRVSATGDIPAGTVAYLGKMGHFTTVKCRAETASDFLDAGLQVEALTARAAHLVAGCALRLAEGEGSMEQAFADGAIELVRAARAHCQLLVLVSFIDGIGRAILSGPSSGAGLEFDSRTASGLLAQLQELRKLYALSVLEGALGDLLEITYVSAAQAQMVRRQLASQLAAVRPAAVPLVDAFAFSDHLLGSALGRFDGDVYRHLYEQAMRDPINQSDVVPGYEQHIRPLIRQEVWSDLSEGQQAVARL